LTQKRDLKTVVWKILFIKGNDHSNHITQNQEKIEKNKKYRPLPLLLEKINSNFAPLCKRKLLINNPENGAAKGHGPSLINFIKILVKLTEIFSHQRTSICHPKLSM
jgi:hypothetical protein